jgi:hypothetical protein
MDTRTQHYGAKLKIKEAKKIIQECAREGLTPDQIQKASKKMGVTSP